MLASFTGDDSLGLGSGRGQTRVVRADSDLAQLTADVPRRPCGLRGVGAAHMQERPIGKAAQVDAVGWAERGDRRVPGGAFLWAVSRRFRADGLDGMVVVIQLAV